MLLGLVLSLGAPGGAVSQGTLSALETDRSEIARAARPAVVSVFAQRSAKRPGDAERRVHTKVGSGVAVAPNEILTTASVVARSERVLIRTEAGLQLDAEVVGADSIFNLAVLRVADLQLPALEFAGSRAAREGDWTMTLGTSYRVQPTQSVGQVAYRHREPHFTLLQLSNVVYPGNSGGAVIDARGHLVGIVQGELARELDRDGRQTRVASFALAAETVRPIYETLRRSGRLVHGYLGVSTQAVNVESSTEPGMRVPIGARVERVQQGGPAHRAGIRRGDLIVGFESERVEYPDQLARWIAASQPGTTVELVWVRNELRHSAQVTLTSSPFPSPQWAPSPVATRTDPVTGRISELEREVRRLRRELGQLKTQ